MKKMAGSALRADSTLSPTLICEYTRKIEKSDQIVKTMIEPVSNDIEYLLLAFKMDARVLVCRNKKISIGGRSGA